MENLIKALELPKYVEQIIDFLEQHQNKIYSMYSKQEQWSESTSNSEIFVTIVNTVARCIPLNKSEKFNPSPSKDVLQSIPMLENLPTEKAMSLDEYKATIKEFNKHCENTIGDRIAQSIIAISNLFSKFNLKFSPFVGSHILRYMDFSQVIFEVIAKVCHAARESELEDSNTLSESFVYLCKAAISLGIDLEMLILHIRLRLGYDASKIYNSSIK